MCAPTESIDTTSGNDNCRVLVTGATGYIAINCIQQLLKQGYKVRGTVRDLNCAAKIDPLRQLANSDRLELFRANLEDDVDIWEQASQDCTYLLHVASPCMIVADKDVTETTVSGTLNVLRGAARKQCVKKVVLTGSSGAVNVGHNDRRKVFTEKDWTNLNWKHLHPYHRAKILAEQAAWNFMEKNPDVSFSLTVLNPSLNVGPLLQNNKGASATIISRFLDGSMPAYPPMKMALVDVRDVARAHILAMKEPKSDGQRILITAEALSFRKISKILRKEFAEQGYKVPRFKTPYTAMWLYARVDAEARQALPLYNHVDNFDNSKSCQLLGMTYHNVKKSLVEMVYDMIERGILPKKKQYAEDKKRADLIRKKSSTMYPDRTAIVM